MTLKPGLRLIDDISDPLLLSEVYRHGQDAWANGLDTQAYLSLCSESSKYKQGSWFALQRGRHLVSSLLVYERGFDLPELSIGIGSVATDITLRRRGFARELILAVVRKFELTGTMATYLFSDIDPAYYESLGFRALGAEDGSVCMVRGLEPGAPPKLF